MSKKENKEELNEKLTIYDYEQKYTRRENARGAKLLLKLIAAAIGVFLFFCMFSITMKIFDINLYAGIGAAVVCVILYIFLFIVPLVKIVKTEYFVVNVNAKTALAAKKHNRQVRRNLADKIIDLDRKSVV